MKAVVLNSADTQAASLLFHQLRTYIPMLISLLLVILGVVFVIWGADRFTEGSVALAAKMRIPEVVIGLTVVAFGTSAPEFFVSLTSALNDTADMAVGNIVGSNIFNTLFIVGCTAIVLPIATTKVTVKKDIPFATLASVILVALCYDNNLSRWDTVILLVFLSLFMYNTFREARRGKLEEQAAKIQTMPIWRAVIWFFVGLLCLVLGSKWFVEAASDIARSLGVSDAIIGLTIVAGGTALPELATCIVAAHKGNSAIAIGNIIGSNILNILLILGATTLISPMQHLSLLPLDYILLLVTMVLLWCFAYTRYRVERWEGYLFVVLYLVYVALLIAYTQGYRFPWLGMP